MNKLVSILGGLAIAFSVSSAQAIETYWDIDFFAPSDGWLKKGDVLKDVFNIVDEGGPLDVGGFDPDTEEVFEAWVYLGLYDDIFRDRKEPKEVVRIKLGGDRLAKGPVPWKFRSLFFGDWEIEGDLLVDLNEDGELKYSVRAIKGDFGVAFAMLEARAEKGGGTSVPETGSTLVMLGVSMLMFESIRRKKNA